MEAKEGLDQAAVIARALDQYKNEHGVFPQALDRLVPKYLPAVPAVSTDMRAAFRFYYHTTLPGYRLGFSFGAGGDCALEHPHGQWVCSSAI